MNIPGRRVVLEPPYRYQIEQSRQPSLLVAKGGRLTFLMVNPSDASHQKNDPTWTRCIHTADRLGYSEVAAVNLYGMVSSKPGPLLSAGFDTAIGPKNDHYILELVARSRAVIVAYGTHPITVWTGHDDTDRAKGHVPRCIQVLRMIEAHVPNVELLCLRYTTSGAPEHPLYLPKDLEPQKFVWRKSFRVQAFDDFTRWWRVPGDYTMSPNDAFDVFVASATFEGPVDGCLLFEVENGTIFHVEKKVDGIRCTKIPQSIARRIKGSEHYTPLRVTVPTDWECSNEARVPEEVTRRPPVAVFFRGKLRCPCGAYEVPTVTVGEGGAPLEVRNISVQALTIVGAERLGLRPTRDRGLEAMAATVRFLETLRTQCSSCKTTYRINPKTQITWN